MHLGLAVLEDHGTNGRLARGKSRPGFEGDPSELRLARVLLCGNPSAPRFPRSQAALYFQKLQGQGIHGFRMGGSRGLAYTPAFTSV